jgi:hypothetical protein
MTNHKRKQSDATATSATTVSGPFGVLRALKTPAIALYATESEWR